MQIWSTVHTGLRRGTVGFGGLLPAVLAGTVHLVVLIALAVLALQAPRVGGEPAGDQTLHLAVEIIEADTGTPDAPETDVPPEDVPPAEVPEPNPDEQPETPPNPQDQARDDLDQQARQLALAADQRAVQRHDEELRARQQDELDHQRQLREQQIREDELRRQQAETQLQQLEEIRRRRAERERQLLEQQQAQQDQPEDPDSPWREETDEWDQAFDRLPVPEPPSPTPPNPQPTNPDPVGPQPGTPGGQINPGTPALTPEQARQRSELLYRYRDSIVRRIERAKQYPQLAERRGQQGQVVVQLTINATGQLIGRPTVVTGCGHSLLDEEAVECIVRAAPFGALPNDKTELTFEIMIEFRLR